MTSWDICKVKTIPSPHSTTCPAAILSSTLPSPKLKTVYTQSPTHLLLFSWVLSNFISIPTRPVDLPSKTNSPLSVFIIRNLSSTWNNSWVIRLQSVFFLSFQGTGNHFTPLPQPLSFSLNLPHCGNSHDYLRSKSSALHLWLGFMAFMIHKCSQLPEFSSQLMPPLNLHKLTAHCLLGILPQMLYVAASVTPLAISHFLF